MKMLRQVQIDIIAYGFSEIEKGVFLRNSENQAKELSDVADVYDTEFINGVWLSTGDDNIQYFETAK